MAKSRRQNRNREILLTLHVSICGGTFCRAPATGREESPDRAGHPAVESADGSNLMRGVTENNRRPKGTARVKTWGKSPRRDSVTDSGYAARACKTKYTDR